MPPPRFLWFMLRSMGRVLGRRLLGRPKDPRWPFVFEMIVETLGQVSDYTLGLPVTEARAFQESLAQPLTLPVRRETRALAGVEAELFLSAPRAPAERGSGAILYLHGGSYLVGSSRTHAPIIGRLALSGVPVWALNYEHAPERSLAEIRDQALAAYRALRERTEGPIALAGDSAGGSLCLLLLLALKERGEPQPAGAALIAPWVDMRSRSVSHEENGRWDWGTGAMLRRHAEQVARGVAIEGPLYIPLMADLSGLPPILIHAGELELQRDDSLSLCARLEEAGVEAEIKVWPAMVHDFHLFADQLPLAEEANAELRAFLLRRLERASG